MRTFKFKSIVSIIFILIMTTLLPAQERMPRRVTMDDLTDPKSPSYVPFPYPETREEIIENLKHYIPKLYPDDSWKNDTSRYIHLLPELIKEEPGAKVGEIVKVKNRIFLYADSYSYLILIHDLDEKYTARVVMKANGLLASGSDPTEKYRGHNIKKFDKVIEKLNKHFRKADVKSIERVAYGKNLASMLYPFYEITLQDGSKYYYDDDGKAFKKIKEIEFKGDVLSDERSEFSANEKRKLKKDETHVFDSISKKFIVLKKLK